MAKKGGAGITAKAPKPNKKGKGKKQKAQGYPGLNADQSALINQTQQHDLQLGGYAGSLMPGIEGSYGQPFDYSQLPQTPWSQGQSLEDMNTEYYDKALANYDRSMEAANKEEDQAFRQQMYNEGVPEGSEKYQMLYQQKEKARSAARQNAMDSAYFNAGQNASNWNNIGTQNFQNAYGFAQDQRNQPLADYSRLMAAQSGLNMQNANYYQQRGLQDQQYKNQLGIIKNTPRGGGGGGGGGAGPLWQQYGFKSPMEYDAYKQNMSRDSQMWEWQNNPQYRQGGGDSSSGFFGLAGNVLGSALGGWAQGGFKSPFK